MKTAAILLQLCQMKKNATISRALGSSDSAVYTMNMPANMEDASKLSKLLQLYSDEPLQPHREEIYHTVKTMCMAEYCDPLNLRLRSRGH